MKDDKIFELVALECSRALANRIQAISGSDDFSTVLDEAGIAQANQLHRVLNRNSNKSNGRGPWRRRGLDPKTELLGLGVLASWHWVRYRVLPPGQRDEDFYATLDLCEKIPEPRMMPDTIRGLLEDGYDLNSIRASYLNERASTSWREYLSTGQPDPLKQSIDLFSRAVAALPAGHSDLPMYLSNYSSALAAQSRMTDSQPDLDQAVAIGRRAIDSTPATHSKRALYLSNYGNTLLIRFSRTGRQEDLDDAVKAGFEAVQVTPADSPERTDRLSNLGAALRNRYELNGDRNDLEQAIQVGHEAVKTASSEHPERAAMLTNYANSLRAMYELSDELEYLDEAIRVDGEAVLAASSGHPDRAMYLSNYAAALCTRFTRTDRGEDLDEAVRVGGEAIEMTPPNHPGRMMYQTNQANALVARFKHTGNIADLDEAIQLCAKTIQTAPPDHPDLVPCLSTYSRALLLRAMGGDTAEDIVGLLSRSIGGDIAKDLMDSIAHLKQAAEQTTASSRNRLKAAQAWATCALLAGDLGLAAEAFDNAVTLLPELAWQGLRRVTREGQLSEWPGLACDAAAAAVIAGRPERAVELLELGRSVLWRQLLDLRSDLALLDKEDRNLAAELRNVREQLDDAAAQPPPQTEQSGAQRDLNERRRELARQWDMLVDQVRHRPGFEHFLGPTPFAKLRQAAAGGPVAIINVSQLFGCHVLLLTPDRENVTVLSLPSLNLRSVIANADILGQILRRAALSGRTHLDRERDRHALLDILEWLWKNVSEPVLNALGFATIPDEGHLMPRVWWCPTGPLATLPIHAAGLHTRTTKRPTAARDTVAGRVVSSYTPTLGALIRAQTSHKSTGQVRQLVIAVSDAPGTQPLPTVDQEAAIFAAYIPEPRSATHLTGAKATRATALAAIPLHNWVHFACHAFQHPHTPSASAFALWDWKQAPLTLADLSALQLDDADLAFLSACQTATGDTRLADESIHLSAAMQLIGFRHVIATLWSIQDASALVIADAVYQRIISGEGDARKAPYALHDAIEKLRKDYPDNPLVWAPYIHTGP